MLWNLECHVGLIKPKEKYVRISMKKIWRNLDGPPKNKELWQYVVKFEFSRPKVAQGDLLFCFVYTLCSLRGNYSVYLL